MTKEVIDPSWEQDSQTQDELVGFPSGAGVVRRRGFELTQDDVRAALTRVVGDPGADATVLGQEVTGPGLVNRIDPVVEALRRSESERLRLSELLARELPRHLEHVEGSILELAHRLDPGSPSTREQLESSDVHELHELRRLRAELESELTKTQAALEWHQEVLGRVYSSRRWRWGSRLARESGSDQAGEV